MLIALIFDSTKSLIARSLVIGVAFAILLVSTTLVIHTHYYGAESKLKYRDELRQIYNQELPKLDSNYDQIAKLNPNAAVLVNQDSPIATTIELRTDLIKRMTEAEREAVEALKTKYEIEQSLFSIFI